MKLGLICMLTMVASSLITGRVRAYAEGAYYHALEGGANGDTNSIGEGSVVAHGHSIGPCNLWHSATAANSITYVVSTGCELWAYSDYNAQTGTCKGTNTFYTGENPKQDQSTGRAIAPSKCFVICCHDSKRGRAAGSKIQGGDIVFGLDALLGFQAAGANQNPTATDCLMAIDSVKASKEPFATGSPCSNIAAYGNCHIAFCGGGTGDDKAPQVTKSAAELAQVGTSMVLQTKLQHPCTNGKKCQGPDIDHTYFVTADVEVAAFDHKSTIYHMFAWNE